MATRDCNQIARNHLLLLWAQAMCVSRITEVAEVRGFSIIPRCTRHFQGCGCASGTVRLYTTNHHKTSASRAFEQIRHALGAISWREDGDIEVLS